MPGIKKYFRLFLAGAALASVFLLQYHFRSFDDNRLTSWEPVFRFAAFRQVLLLLCLGLLAAVPLARLLFLVPYRSGLLFLSAFGLGMLFREEPELIVDASRYFAQAKYLELSGPAFFLREWGREIFAWTDLPALPFMYGLIFRYAGESRLAIQLFTTFCFAMTAALTFLLGRKLWDEEAGFTAGLLLLGSPYLFSQVPLLLVDVPLMFLLLLSVYLFILALERGGLLLPAAAFAIVVTFFAKYSAWLLLTELAVVFAVYRFPAEAGSQDRHGAKTRLQRGLLVFGMAAAGIAGMAWLQAGVMQQQLALLKQYQGPGLRRWGESFVSTFLFQVHPVLTLAAVVSCVTALWKRDIRYLLVCWLPLLLVALQIMRIRYLLPVFPLLSLMAAHGLMQVQAAELRRYLLTGVVLSSVLVAVFAFRPFLYAVSSVNLKQAGAFLDTLGAPGAEVFTLYPEASPAGPAVVVPLLDLFTAKQLTYHDTVARDLHAEEIRISPLRFTWEYSSPAYYRRAAGQGKDALVIIQGRKEERLPEELALREKGYRNVRVFEQDEEEFEFKTFVRVCYD